MKLDTDKLLQSLYEEEIHSFMRNVLLRLDLLETTEYPEKQFITDIRDLKSRYWQLYEHRTNPRTEYEEQQVSKVHIVFDFSSRGSLKVALRDVLALEGEKVIAISDTFSVGPIWQLHTEDGVKKRKEWLFYNINLDEEYIDGYVEEFDNARAQISSIPDDIPINIWCGDNSHEQTGLRLALYLLKGKSNPIKMINATQEYHTVFPEKKLDGYPLQIAEITPEKLSTIYQKAIVNKLTPIQRQELEEEWLSLSKNDKKLRLWENGHILSVSGGQLDEFIIQSLQKLHKERGSNDFIKSARLIGEVIGHASQVVGDGFIEYRIRELIVKGIFDIKGVPKAMRFYEVKLHSP
ncbi:DUF1835 domain-containing protein [Virgibacillus sp. FSP13]